jgi:hypothetical protein
MSKNGPRPVFFVCISVDANTKEFVSKQIQAISKEEASSLFLKQTSLKPQIIYGPFRLKRTPIPDNIRILKFSDITYKAIYNDWIVNAMYLKEPKDNAYLLFIKRVDDKKLPVPKGTIVVPISDLRLI